MIHVLSDDPDGADQMETLKQALGPAEVQQLNVTMFDGQRIDFDVLVGACEAMPFLADRRLVLVRGLLSRLEARAEAADRKPSAPDRKPSELARQIEQYLPRLPATVDLVFLEAMTIAKRNPLHKALLAAGARFGQTPFLEGEALASWIQRRVAAKGGRIARAAAALLASYGARDLRSLDNELETLVAFAGEEEIDQRGIAQLVAEERERNVYRTADAMSEGRVGAALGQFRGLLDAGESPLWVLTMIVRHFRQLIQVKDLQARGLRPDAIATQLGMKPFGVERLQRQLRRYSDYTQLEYILRRLLDADVASKSGGRDIAVSIELLMTELASKRQ